MKDDDKKLEITEPALKDPIKNITIVSHRVYNMLEKSEITPDKLREAIGRELCIGEFRVVADSSISENVGYFFDSEGTMHTIIFEGLGD